MKRLAEQLWRPSAAAYLAICLAGLAAGTWPEAFYPLEFGRPNPAPLPTLQLLAQAQLAYFWIIYPVVLMRRRRRSVTPPPGRYVLVLPAETLMLLAAALPLYLVAAWLGDATRIDVARVVLTLLLWAPLGWVLGSLLDRPLVASPAMTVVMLISVGAMAVYYATLEFLSVEVADRLWEVLPGCVLWSASAARQGRFLPSSLAASLVWPLIAGACGLVMWAYRRTSQAAPSS